MTFTNKDIISLVSIFLLLIIGRNLMAQERIYVVNTADDRNDGVCNAQHCSFREAILAAEQDNLDSKITFSGLSLSNLTIRPSAPFPSIEHDNLIVNDNLSLNKKVILDFSYRIFGGVPFWKINANNIKIEGLEFVKFNFDNSIEDVILRIGGKNSLKNIEINRCNINTTIGTGNDNGTIHKAVYVTNVDSFRFVRNCVGCGLFFIDKTTASIIIDNDFSTYLCQIDSNIFVSRLLSCSIKGGKVSVTGNNFGSLTRTGTLEFLDPYKGLIIEKIQTGIIEDNFFFGYNEAALELNEIKEKVSVLNNTFNSNGNSSIVIQNHSNHIEILNNTDRGSNVFLRCKEFYNLEILNNIVSRINSFIISDTITFDHRLRYYNNSLFCVEQEVVINPNYRNPSIISFDNGVLRGFAQSYDSVIIYANSRSGCPEAICQGGKELERTQADANGV